MRTIKFRAWNIINKEMWYDFHSQGGGMFEKAIELSNDGKVKEFELMQFTGLLDRNGKEIWEGDVVSIPYIDPLGGLHVETEDGRAKVGFENGQFVLYRVEPQPLIGWCKKEKGEYVPNYGNKTIISNETVLKVIGNVMENPELLKS